MKISILGTGSIGLGYAAFLSSHGHDVTLWSPSGQGVRDLLANSCVLQSGGRISGEFHISPRIELQEAVAEAQVVIFAVPGNGHEKVMRAAARHVRSSQLLAVTPVVSLGACVLSKFAAEYGAHPLICASSTTVLTARKTGPASVNILTIRPEVDLASLPSCEIDRVMAKMEMIFGPVFYSQPNILASSLSNTGPVAHVPLALMNMSRMERGESWLQYEHFSENISRVMQSVDRERILVGEAFGLPLRGIEEHFCRSFGTQPGTLENVAAQLVKMRSGGPLGPTTARTRYLTEDVPFGLAFFSYLGKLKNVATPATDACIALANIALGEDLPRQNGLLQEIRTDILSWEDMIEVASGRFPGRET